VQTCGGTGLKGRMGIHELLIMDETVRRVALTDLTADSIRNAAIFIRPSACAPWFKTV
jgi:type IV pilus assembly protein PilB